MTSRGSFDFKSESDRKYSYNYSTAHSRFKNEGARSVLYETLEPGAQLKWFGFIDLEYWVDAA